MPRNKRPASNREFPVSNILIACTIMVAVAGFLVWNIQRNQPAVAAPAETAAR